MNNFIKEQIDSYNGKKYSIKNELQSFVNNPLYLYIKIIDNKVIANKPPNHFRNAQHSLDRKNRIIKMIQNSIKLNKINNTEIIIKLFDTYEWEYNIPCFNLTVPKNKQGFIFPHYDFIKFNKLGIDYDTLKLKIQNYNPKIIENNIYFKGRNTTNTKSNIRIMLSQLKYPFSVKINNDDIPGDNTEPIYFLKKHKYLLDLPGLQPWSVRFKYLCLCERVFIRISFYNSKFEEKDYWKQFSDLYFRENIDYVHLKYDIDFEKPLTKKLFIKISKDIENIYNNFEANPHLYAKMVNNLKKSAEKLSLNNVYEYISKMINSYTKNLLII
jgi:hypothetical protein